jgi:exodeoxyribonuclease-5
MTKAQPVQLNAGQQAAAEGFFEFLLSPGKELIISGPGGVGKTFLMGYLINEIMPRYHDMCALMNIPSAYDDVVMTATTNKAAEVLARATGRPTATVHSFFNLKVVDDYKTGKSQLTKTRSWRVHNKMIIFVDEASMIDQPLLNLIREGSLDCKIIYVGDHCQLAPIMEPISPIYRANLPFFELTEPMRNSERPALMDLCNQLRRSVETNEFKPIKIVPGVVDHLDDDQMEAEVQSHFQTETSSRILAYTNERVVDYNDHIRSLRSLTTPYTLGEILINNSAVHLKDGLISVEEEVEIIKLGEIEEIEIAEDIHMQIIRADLQNKFEGVYAGMMLPVDKDHYTKLVKYFQKMKNWTAYFFLKNNFPDLRPRDAATVHKAQGSTYDTTFIDVGNLSTCRNPNLAARLLYVAVTRARSRIILYGDLADKYGGITH